MKAAPTKTPEEHSQRGGAEIQVYPIVVVVATTTTTATTAAAATATATTLPMENMPELQQTTADASGTDEEDASGGGSLMLV